MTLRVTVGADDTTYGTYTLTPDGLKLSGNVRELRAILNWYRPRHASDEAFLRALPHHLNGRTWAALSDHPDEPDEETPQ